MQTIRLNNGVAMPMVGFGVFQMAPEVCERAVAEALEVGYRLIDTASSYKNERAVGAAIRRSGLPREALFVTSKAFVNEMGREATREACLRSLDNLGLDRLDLYLIHMPYGDVVGAWRAMEALLREGRVRAIGVSNFQGDRLLDLCQCAEIAPAVDQLELHPYYQRAGEGGDDRARMYHPVLGSTFGKACRAMRGEPDGNGERLLDFALLAVLVALLALFARDA